MDEEIVIKALSVWLLIKPEEVRQFILMHRCKPLPLSELINLLTKSK